MMSDLWTEAQERALLRVWCAEIVRAVGGVPSDPKRKLMIASVALSRSLILDMDALARIGKRPDAPIFRTLFAQNVVRMAGYLRALGLTRHDVHRLDLGRRRRTGVP